MAYTSNHIEQICFKSDVTSPPNCHAFPDMALVPFWSLALVLQLSPRLDKTHHHVEADLRCRSPFPTAASAWTSHPHHPQIFLSPTYVPCSPVFEWTNPVQHGYSSSHVDKHIQLHKPVQYHSKVWVRCSISNLESIYFHKFTSFGHSRTEIWVSEQNKEIMAT